MQNRVPQPQSRTIGGPAPINGNVYQVVRMGEFFYIHDVRRLGVMFRTLDEKEAYGGAEALNHGWKLPEDFATAPAA